LFDNRDHSLNFGVFNQVRLTKFIGVVNVINMHVTCNSLCYSDLFFIILLLLNLFYYTFLLFCLYISLGLCLAVLYVTVAATRGEMSRI